MKTPKAADRNDIAKVRISIQRPIPAPAGRRKSRRLFSLACIALFLLLLILVCIFFQNPMSLDLSVSLTV